MKNVFKKLPFLMVLGCLLVVPLFGCANSYYQNSANQKTSQYTHSENDGHAHRYVHRLSDDKYICQDCGKEYKGDPKNLVEE